jgi:hypothetical protein
MLRPIQYLAFLPILAMVSLSFSDFNSGLIRIFFPIAIFLSIILGIGPYIVQGYRKSIVAREEYLENLQEGGIEEPRPLRSLSKEEAVTLRSVHKRLQWIAGKISLLVILFIFIDVVFFLAITWSVLSSIIGEVVMILVLVLIFEGWVIVEAFKERKRYLDLRSPVFKVQGKAIKGLTTGEERDNYYIIVRSIKFSDRNYGGMKNFYRSIKDEDEVAVEYSPRTKHVWKMNKTQDLK